MWRHMALEIFVNIGSDIMACCLTARSHYLNKCWLTISYGSIPEWCLLEHTQDINIQIVYVCYLLIWILQWRHNGHNGVSNHQPHDCLLNRLFRRRSKKTSKLCVTGLCAGNSPVTGEFPAQMASNAENISIWWRHHETIATSSRGQCGRDKTKRVKLSRDKMVTVLQTTFSDSICFDQSYILTKSFFFPGGLIDNRPALL